ncbi:TPM domain-containing protein [Methylomonas koyamae]|uniref:TPM domain-containing protein n=1 Tax=Methylomonas koyamae TaxID=702114 RepID=UPI002873810B|nr:YgcG family protein [Methylomonas koyamae]WNB73872.1 YgcG family protein [Methylomonas koyamae]
MRDCLVLRRPYLAWMLVCLALIGPAAAQQAPIPDLSRRVTDTVAALTPAQQTALEQKLAGFEAEKGSQIAVLIVASTQPEDIAQYSIRVVEQWRLGRKGVDDGILLLVAKDDRTTRIEVGYGLEGVVPDALAKRIIEDIMIPKFRQGDFAGGVNAGVDSLIGLIQGEPLPAVQSGPAGERLSQYLPHLFIAAIFVGGLLRAIFGKVLGGLATGGAVGAAVWLLGGGLLLALLLAFMAFVISLSDNRGRRGGYYGGGFDGFGGGGGGFSGGGGGFGGGGASGRW